MKQIRHSYPPPPPPKKIRIIRWKPVDQLAFNDYVKTQKGFEGYVVATKQDGRKCLVEFKHLNNKQFWFSTSKLQKRIDNE